MSSGIRRQWPLSTVIGMYWAVVLGLVIYSCQLNSGHLVYALDDTYIHMAMAKNTVLHSVWGVTKYGFTSTTSSPLWTLLLAVGYLIFGINEIAPLLLNLLFSTLTIAVSYSFLIRHIKSFKRIFLILLTAAFVAPLPTLTMIGMEHSLHVLLSLSVIFLFTQALAIKKNSNKYFVLLLILSPLLVMARYEGLFLVFMICLFLLLEKRLFHALALAAAAAVPVVAYGIWSMTKGWFFLPNSILLKALQPAGTFKSEIILWILSPLQAIQGNGLFFLLLTVMPILTMLLYRKKSRSSFATIFANLIVIGAFLLHMQFSSTAQFFRYEAYLVFLGIILIGVTANTLWPERLVLNFNKARCPFYAATLCLIVIAGTPFFLRASQSVWGTPKACKNIYEQQYQMAKFLRHFYQGETIVLNDIGAATYLAEIKLIDLFGLGSMEPAKLKLGKKYRAMQIFELASRETAKIAIIYDSWFDRETGMRRPEEWMAVGQWHITNNVVCGDDVVSFYAVDPSESERLQTNLHHFGKELPADVIYIEEK